MQRNQYKPRHNSISKCQWVKAQYEFPNRVCIRGAGTCAAEDLPFPSASFSGVSPYWELGIKVGDLIGLWVRGRKDKIMGLREGTRLGVEAQGFDELVRDLEHNYFYEF